MSRLSGFKGFTLVELILVVLIVGILAGIVIPRITYTAAQAREQAADATVARVNATLEYAHVADDMAYPDDAAGFTAFLGNGDYFPEGVSMPTDFTINYNTTSDRAYRTP